MMRLEAAWLHQPGTVAVFDALAGHGAWFVGGCVRNGLIGAPVEDLDICTDAPPQTVLARAGAAGLRAVPTGIAHGTVTVVADGTAYEITTLRRDVETDGRRATVAFTDRISEDAARRDFTMNALYATREGHVLDPNGAGLADLAARRVRFIGLPAERIAEDYLRILRFFRFQAWYADPDGGIDPDGLAACAAGIDGLRHVSIERIGAEMRKLLSAPDPSRAVMAMDATGVLACILPGAEALRLRDLTRLDGRLPPEPIRRLAALGGEDAPTRLRLSKADTARFETYRRETFRSRAGNGELGYRYGAAEAHAMLVLRSALVGGHPPHAVDLQDIETGAAAKFPVSAADLMPGLAGPALGARLAELEARWIASRFTLSKAELLAG